MASFSQKATELYNSPPLKQFQKGDCGHQLFVAVKKMSEKIKFKRRKGTCGSWLPSMVVRSLWWHRGAQQRTWGTAKRLISWCQEAVLHISVQESAFNGLTSVRLYLPAAAQVGDQTLTLERLGGHSKF